ncbi:hypothetical protein EMCRGX_G021780 [Ephydatia muelleri]
MTSPGADECDPHFNDVFDDVLHAINGDENAESVPDMLQDDTIVDYEYLNQPIYSGARVSVLGAYCCFMHSDSSFGEICTYSCQQNTANACIKPLE